MRDGVGFVIAIGGIFLITIPHPILPLTPQDQLFGAMGLCGEVATDTLN